jgi:hypothetical protein
MVDILHILRSYLALIFSAQFPNACDTYAADMVAIHVLVLPKPTLVTPCKHKVYDKMDQFASLSPSKKAQIMSLKL